MTCMPTFMVHRAPVHRARLSWGGEISIRVRASARGAMDRGIGASCGSHLAISRSSQYSTTGVTKAVLCAILYVEWCI